MIRRCIALLLLFSVLSSGCASWHAGTSRCGGTDLAQVQADSTSYMSCDARGRADGKARDASGSVLGGFCGGLVLGVIGTFIAVVAQDEPEPPATMMLTIEDDRCRYVYAEAYRSAAKRAKRDNALMGGALGTATGVAILLVLAN